MADRRTLIPLVFDDWFGENRRPMKTFVVARRRTRALKEMKIDQWTREKFAGRMKNFAAKREKRFFSSSSSSLVVDIHSLRIVLIHSERVRRREYLKSLLNLFLHSVSR